LDSTAPSSAAANVDPFVMPSGFAYSPFVLASDDAGLPHVFVSTQSALVHFHALPGSAAFVSDELTVTGDATVTGMDAVSARAGSGMSVLFSATDPNRAYRQALRLASGDGDGVWSVAAIYDGDGTSELWAPAVSLDTAGQPVVFYVAEAVSDRTASLFRWRDGATVSLPSTESGRMSLFATAGSQTASAVVANSHSDGIHVQVVNEGQIASDLVVPNTQGLDPSALDGCPVHLHTMGDPMGCGGFKDTQCTLTGGQSTFSSSRGLRATADGAVWLVFYVISVDADVMLRESCTGGPDRACSCSAEVVADRSHVSLRIARVPTTASDTNVDIRLDIRMRDGGFASGYSYPNVEALGTRLYIARGPGAEGATTVRYVVIDTTRL
jgi:hypothetical protein